MTNAYDSNSMNMFFFIQRGAKNIWLDLSHDMMETKAILVAGGKVHAISIYPVHSEDVVTVVSPPVIDYAWGQFDVVELLESPLFP